METRICIKCNTEKSIDEFYSKKGHFGKYTCKECSQTAITNMRRGRKAEAVAYLGGKCMLCGTIDSPEVYDFHHMDPTIKDFTISDKVGASLESLKEELDKCILLCSNCHRKVHAKGNILINENLGEGRRESSKKDWRTKISRFWQWILGGRCEKQNPTSGNERNKPGLYDITYRLVLQSTG